MYKTVYDLTRDELNELKQAYFVQLSETNPEIINGYNLLTTDSIPDNVIFEHYDGISFVDEDFFCNIKDGNYEGCGAVYK